MPSRDDSLAEEGAEQGGQLLHALGSAGHGLCDRVQLDAEEGQALGRPLSLVGVHDQAELTNDRLCGEQVAGHVFLRLGDEKEVVEVADVVDALLGEGDLNDRQQLRAHAWRGAQAKRHGGELVQLALEAEAEVLAHGRVQREGQEAVGQVQLAVPAAGRRRFDGVVHAAVAEVVVLQVVVEVARQVDDQARLLAVLDDDVQRLDAQATVVERGVCGEADECAELHVLAEALANSVGVLCDRRRVGVGVDGRGRDEGKRHTLSDVRLDVGELAQVRAWLSTHAGDGGQPALLLRCTLNEGHERGRGGRRRRGRGREWRERGGERDGWQHVLMHVAQ